VSPPSWRYGLQTFPERWHRVLNEALTIRRADRARADVASAAVEMLADVGWRAASTALYESPAARRRDVLAFADMVIADATNTATSGRSRNHYPVDVTGRRPAGDMLRRCISSWRRTQW
jgi:hypothetical protein